MLPEKQVVTPFLAFSYGLRARGRSAPARWNSEPILFSFPPQRPATPHTRKEYRLVGTVEGNHPERNAGGFGHDPETALVSGIMVKKAYYCSEHQSVDEAREIMREHHLQYLPVVDGNMCVVGMVALRDLAAIEATATK